MPDDSRRSLQLLIARGAAMCLIFGMITMMIAGFTTYYNFEYGYIGAGTIFWILMLLFGFISFITYWLVRYVRKSYQLVLLAIISMPGSLFIGGIILLVGAIRVHRRTKDLLDALAESSVPKNWEQIVKKLQNMDDSGDTEGLIKIFETEKNLKTRTLALVHLFHLADSKTIPVFTRALRDKAKDIQLWGALGLAQFGRLDGLNILEIGMQHEEPRVRRVIVEVLGNLDDPKVTGILQRATTDSDTTIRDIAQQVLAKRKSQSPYEEGKRL